MFCKSGKGVRGTTVRSYYCCSMNWEKAFEVIQFVNRSCYFCNMNSEKEFEVLLFGVRAFIVVLEDLFCFL